jgi:hypothetical protein
MLMALWKPAAPEGVVVLIAGGGEQIITEVQGHLRAHFPVIALRGADVSPMISCDRRVAASDSSSWM